MDDPGRLLPKVLRENLARHPARANQLLNALNDYLPSLWTAMEGLQWADAEEDFIDIDPPKKWRLPASLASATDPAERLIGHLQTVPLRWRMDVAMGLFVFLTLDVRDEPE